MEVLKRKTWKNGSLVLYKDMYGQVGYVSLYKQKKCLKTFVFSDLDKAKKCFKEISLDADIALVNINETILNKLSYYKDKEVL